MTDGGPTAGAQIARIRRAMTDGRPLSGIAELLGVEVVEVEPVLGRIPPKMRLASLTTLFPGIPLSRFTFLCI